MAYEMWKNTIDFFHLKVGCTDELIMPITYQSIKGDVALDIMTHGPHMNLHELITWLDNNFGVVSDERHLDERVVHHQTRHQGICETLQYSNQLHDDEAGCHLPTCHATEQAEETRKTHFLSRLHPNLKSTLAWEMCLDGGGQQMTYEKIKDAARLV